MAEKRMTNEYVEMKMGRIEQACQRCRIYQADHSID